MENNDLYSEKSRLKWILIAIEWERTQNMQTSLWESATIEHIFPQTPTDKQKREFNNNAKGIKWSEKVHTLGNLTLLEHNNNSKAKNKNVDAKKKIMTEQSYYKINIDITTDETIFKLDDLENRF